MTKVWRRSGMARLVGLATLVALALSARPASAGDACVTGIDDVRITFSTDFGPVMHDHRLSQHQIDKIFQSEGSATSGIMGKPVGLTRTAVSLDFQTRVQPVRLDDGSYCLRLSEVDAVVRFVDTVVYIDRKYRVGSCAFRTILEHEHEHVAINRMMLQRFAPHIRAELERAVSRFPVVVSDLAQSRDLPLALLQQDLDPVLTAFNSARELANDAIDTSGNYHDTHARCRVW